MSGFSWPVGLSNRRAQAPFLQLKIDKNIDAILKAFWHHLAKPGVHFFDFFCIFVFFELELFLHHLKNVNLWILGGPGESQSAIRLGRAVSA